MDTGSLYLQMELGRLKADKENLCRVVAQKQQIINALLEVIAVYEQGQPLEQR